MILSDAEIKKRLIPGDDPEAVIKLWQDELWEEIANRLFIYPFHPRQLEGCSCEIQIGKEYITLRNPYSVQSILENQGLIVNPGETVLILTEQYLCLPRNIMGMVVPRARILFQGGITSSTRIDPTWYGKLAIPFTNLNKFPFRFQPKESFCMGYFYLVNDVEKSLNEVGNPSLNRRTLAGMQFPNIIQQRSLLNAKEVTDEHLPKVVQEYGAPFDVVYGAIELSKDEVKRHVERRLAPRITRDAIAGARAGAYKSLVGLMAALIVAIIVAIVAAIIKVFTNSP